MKSVKSLVACMAACAALVSASAYAEGFYAELGYASIKVEGSGISVRPGDALLRGGYMFTNNFGVEVDAATSVKSDSVGGVDVKIDSAYGAYLKGQFEVAPSFELFAKAGWLHADLKASGGGLSASSSDSSLSYAAGLQYLFPKNWYGQVDYASYYYKNGATARGPSISIGYRFQ